MSKTNFFVKYLKNINNFINNLLEKNLNKLNFKNLSFLLKNNKIILTFVALFVVLISYLLLPTFYNQNDVSKELKNDLQSKFNLNFKFLIIFIKMTSITSIESCKYQKKPLKSEIFEYIFNLKCLISYNFSL